ncbi:MAG: nodulation protein NfeD [Leptospiraceae bacterium]|nr:nodulation protein NfeD [Leptospiraceae bacterium]
MRPGKLYTLFLLSQAMLFLASALPQTPQGSVYAQTKQESQGDQDPSAANPRILRIEMHGMIDQSSHDQLVQGLAAAQELHAAALLLVLDTPGGLMQSMDEIIKTILNAPIPVITWVGPAGASCGSAGVFILYASHISAMAPATNLGSATPLTMGPGGAQDTEDQAIPTEAGTSDSVNLKRKLFHHAIAQIQGLAEFHGRNALFAVESITKARNITSLEARRIGAIDYVAASEIDLLQRIQDRKVRMAGQTLTLDLHTAKIIDHDQDALGRFLKHLSNPQLAYVLFLIGMLGIYAEFNHPGSIYPGVIGAICLLVGLYAMQGLPLNYAAFALIGLGIILFILEMQISSYGLLSIGGILSIVLGSVLLFKDSQIELSDLISIGISALTITLLMSIIVYKAARAQRTPLYSGPVAMIGHEARTRSTVDRNSGTVDFQGEIWQARCDWPVAADQWVTIVAVNDGLVLRIKAEPGSDTFD